jgi:hypothetical protein
MLLKPEEQDLNLEARKDYFQLLQQKEYRVMDLGYELLRPFLQSVRVPGIDVSQFPQQVVIPRGDDQNVRRVLPKFEDGKSGERIALLKMSEKELVQRVMDRKQKLLGSKDGV